MEQEKDIVEAIGPHDDIKLMRAFLWDYGLIDAFEAYCRLLGQERGSSGLDKLQALGQEWENG